MANNTPKKGKLRLDNLEQIINHLNKHTVFKDNCWLWNAYTNTKGYGMVKIEYELYLVHRLSLYTKGKLDINNPDQQALHLNICPNKNCWNPDHLYAGSDLDNKQDLMIKRSERDQNNARS